MQKRQLALLYFPASTPRTACRRLGRWIRRCPALDRRLQELGYHKRRRTFTAAMVDLIAAFLGDP